MAQRPGAVEHDMGGVGAIPPVLEPGVVGLETGHHRQPAAGAQHPAQQVELLRRGVEMLRRLGAGDEIVSARQRRAVGREERIIQRHRMPRLAQHRRQRRAGAAAVIQPLGAGLEPRQQRVGQLRQKGAIARVGGIVLVGQVMRALLRRAQAVGGVEHGGQTHAAAPVVRAVDAQERRRAGRAADRAGDHAPRARPR